jgi:VIT1/CCC1 family predicted Fe2+/Mn2+ transporter
LSKDKKTMADILLLEEGESEEHANSPTQSAFWTFVAFICFGILPLITYAFASTAVLSTVDSDAFWVTSLLTAATLGFLGWIKAKFNGNYCNSVSSHSSKGRASLVAGMEMVIVGGSAALVSYIIAWHLSASVILEE